MSDFLKIDNLALDEAGRVVLGDAELEALSQEFALAGGDDRTTYNNGCQGGPRNTGCSNAGCNGTMNTTCLNSVCSGTSNIGCENQDTIGDGS